MALTREGACAQLDMSFQSSPFMVCTVFTHEQRDLGLKSGAEQHITISVDTSRFDFKDEH